MVLKLRLSDENREQGYQSGFIIRSRYRLRFLLGIYPCAIIKLQKWDFYMTRKNFTDILNNYHIDFQNEILKIEKLFREDKYEVDEFESKYFSIEEYINCYYFLGWKYRNTFLSTDELREAFNVPSPYTCRKKEYSLEDFLSYAEFVINMVHIAREDIFEYFETTVKTIFENIRSILDSNNYKIQVTENNLLIIVANSETVTAVSEIYQDIAPKVIEYNRFSLRGNLERKKELLVTIAHKFEGVEYKLQANNQSALAENVTFLLNSLNLRHNNAEGKHAKNKILQMNNEELEDWYDKTYDTMLLALLYANYTEILPYLKQLKGEFKQSKSV